jgi:hypothetical protein
MQKQTLTIDIPEGFIVDTFDEKSCVIKLKPKPKNVIERIKTISDVINELGENDEDVIIYRKLSTLFNGTSHVVNNQLAIIITKALNEKWVPNWNDSNQSKWFAYFQMGGSSGFRFNDYGNWPSHSNVGSRLCLKSSELAEYAAKQFTEVYKRFMIIE